jgi:hypothetical protein
MIFKHIVVINDPLNPLIDTLTRLQLWQGLVLRAKEPKLFVPHLDECTLVLGEASLLRRLRYGDLVINDEVQFDPQRQVRYDIPAQMDIPPSHLSMMIEEPQPEAFFVRFLYDDGNDQATDATNAMYNEFRRSAYVESDIDTIRVIRELAAEGRLNPC